MSQRISGILILSLFTAFLLLYGVAGTTAAYAQFDKIKKAVDKEKKSVNKNEKGKKVKSEKGTSGNLSVTDNSAGSSSGITQTGNSEDCKTIDDCEDAKAAVNFLNYANMHITEITDPAGAQGYVVKAKESLKKAKANCPGVDLSPVENRLAEIENKLADFNKAADAQTTLSMARNVFDPVVNSILGRGYDGMFSKKNEAQDLYDACAKVDYINLKKTLDDILTKDAGLKEQATNQFGDYTAFMNAYKQFEERVNNYLVGEINRSIEGAYAQKAKGKNNLNDALEAAEAGVLTAKAVLLIIPSHAKITSLLKDAQAATGMLEKEMGGSVYTSSFHKEQAGKIVFSKSPLVIRTEKQEAIVKDFTANDFIYSMAYLKAPVESQTFNRGCVIRMYVDDNMIMFREFTVSEQNKSQTWSGFEIVPDPVISEQSGCVEYSKALSAVSPRTHTVRVEFWNNDYTKLLASGEFNLDATQGLDVLQQNARKLSQKALDKVRMPAAGMQNASFEQVIKKDWTNERYKALRAVIYDKDWKIQRNAITGVIEHRYVWCAVAVKTNEGDCKIFYVSYKQDYAGGSYGAFKSWGMGDNELINCDHVMK